MTPEFRDSKAGPPTAFLGDLALCSTYDPIKEAQRFVDALPPSDTVLLLGAGLGYLEKALASSRPETRVLALYLWPEFYPASPLPTQHLFRQGSDLTAWLDRMVNDADIRGLRVVPWQPALRAYAEGDLCLDIVRRWFRFRQGSVLTENTFGHRWIKNFVRNAARFTRSTSHEVPLKTCVIAASGPSLKSHVELIRKVRDDVLLVALASAYPFLSHMGLEPDYLFQTDPGFWARHHLRALSNDRPPVIMPLTAQPCLPSGTTVIPFVQDLPLETELAPELLRVPPNGTVAGSALSFMHQIGMPRVVLAGLDLAMEDIRSHVSPHAFDPVIAAGLGRTAPLHHVSYSRAATGSAKTGAIRISQSLQTYRTWFQNSVPGPTMVLPGISPFSGVRLQETDSIPLEPAAGFYRFDIPDLATRLAGLLSDVDPIAGMFASPRQRRYVDEPTITFVASAALRSWGRTC